MDTLLKASRDVSREREGLQRHVASVPSS